MWIRTVSVMTLFTVATGLYQAQELTYSAPKGKGENWTCAITWLFEDEKYTYLGEGTTCYPKTDTAVPTLKCLDGIWKHIESFPGKIKRSIQNCPGNIQMDTTGSCETVTWTPPVNAIHILGGNPGDCFSPGVRDVVYAHESDVCTFSITVQRTAIACETDELSISCPSTHKIKIVSANFGRTSLSICALHPNIHNENCHSPSSFSEVRTRCEGHSDCSFTATIETFGVDPCKGIFKYLTVTYVCDPPKFCSPLSSMRNGYRSCTGDASAGLGTVCTHGCLVGYLLEGNAQIACEGAYPQWNPAPPTCRESCSWPKDHCWPGDCNTQFATSCVCRPGFKLSRIEEGNRCEIDTPPNLNTCRVFVNSSSGEVTESKYNANITSCDNQRNESMNSQPTELSFVIKTDLSLTLGASNSYISGSSVGIIGAQITLVRISVTGVQQIISKHSLNDSTFCQQNISEKAPLPSNTLLVCEGTLQLSGFYLSDGESLCADMEAFAGGFYNLQDDTGTFRRQVLFQRVSKKKRVCFLYDVSKPTHCSESGCNKSMLQLSTRTTRSSDINVLIDGWIDPVPVGGSDIISVSHINKLILEVHGVDVNGSVLSVQHSAIVDKTKEVPADPLSPGGPYNLDLSLPETGKARLYAIILEVHDNAGNVGYARRLVLCDNSSSVELRESQTMNVTSADPRSGFKWQTDILRNICVNWRDRFYNNELRRNNFLMPVIEDTGREITGLYDQTDGPISVKGTENVQGVVLFEFAWMRDNGLRSAYEKVSDLQAQNTCLHESPRDGETYEIWVRATDVMGNTKEDSVMVSIDHSSPDVIIKGLRGRFDYDGLVVHNSTDLSKMVLVVDVFDVHSGVDTLHWTLQTMDTLEDVGTRAVGVQEMQNVTNCTGIEFCYCPIIGFCEGKRYLITFNSLMDSNTHEGLHHRDYYITVTTTNKASLTSSDSIGILLDASPPSVGVVLEGFQDEEGEMDFTNDDSVHVYWHGFLDHESDVMMYRVAIASRCLTVAEMENFQNVTVVENGNDVLLEFPSEGNYFTNVVAYNRAMAPSDVACSDGITYDRSPPLLRNVSIVHARTGRTLGCTQDGQVWVVNMNMTRVRLAQTPLCTRVCVQNSLFVSIEHLPLSAKFSMDAEVSTDLCERLKPLTEETPIVMPSDFLRMQWSAKDDQSDMDEFYVGIGQDRTSEMSPDIVPLTRTHGHPFYHLRHSGLGHGAVFFIFLQAVSKAGLCANLTLGPVLIDVTPPQVTQPLTVVTDGDFLSVMWTEGTFMDTEQPDGVDFDVTFRIGHEREFVTPFLSLPETTLARCRSNNITGCVRYPAAALNAFNTESGRSFFFQLHVSNAAGHVTTVNSSSVHLPVHMPPNHAVVFDVLKASMHAAEIMEKSTIQSLTTQNFQTKYENRTAPQIVLSTEASHAENVNSRLSPHSAFMDVDVVIVPDDLCIAWSGFHREDSLHIQVGIGTDENKADLVPFYSVDESPSCVNTTNLPVYVKLFSLVKASNPSGVTVFSSDGFYLIPRNDSQNTLQVFNGKGCTPNDLIGSTLLTSNLSSFDFTLTADRPFHPGDILFISFQPPVSEVLFKNAILLHNTLIGYQVIAKTAHLSGTLYNAKYLNTTVHILNCLKDAILQPITDRQVSVNWEMFGPWTYLIKFLKLELMDTSCVHMSPKKDKYAKERCLLARDNSILQIKRSHVFHEISVISGHVFTAQLSACTDYECFPAVSSFPVLYENTHQSISIETAVMVNCSAHELHIEINAIVQPYINISAITQNRPFVFRWTVSRDRFALRPVSLWKINNASLSRFVQLNDVLQYNGSSQGTLYACIQPVYPWKQDNPSCRKLIRSVNLGQAELKSLHLIELSYEVLQHTNVEEYLHSEQLGSRLHDLYDLDLDFARSDVTISAILTDSNERNVTWFLMTSSRLPTKGDCSGDLACLLVKTSNNGRVVFPQTPSKLQDGYRYFVCARVPARVSTQKDSVHEICGDGFVIDDTPPVSGIVTISNSNSGYLASRSRVLVTWSGFSDVETKVDSLPDDITMTFSVALGRYPGAEDITPFVYVGQRTEWTFEHLDLDSGTICIATVKAQDRVGHIIQSPSDMVIIDTTPPSIGFVRAGKTTHESFVSSMDVPVYWEGIEDKESGITECQVAMAMEGVLEEVIAFERCHGNSALLKGTSKIVDGHSYVILLKASNGAGLTTLISSEPFVIDSSPPSVGLVWNSAPNTSDNAAYTTEAGVYRAHWTGFSDPHSGLAYYRVGLGSQPGEPDIHPFIFVGLHSSYVWLREFDQGRKYYTIVQACNNAKLCNVVSSRSLTVDNSPPTPGIVNVGFDGHHSKFIGHNSSLPVQWIGFSDAQTGIEEFFWCVGHMPAECDVTSFTPTLLSRSTVGTGLSLPVGRRLYVTVRARNPAGLETMGVSDSFMVDITPPEVKEKPHFLSPGDKTASGNQWDRSILTVAWRFYDPESSVVSHTVSIRSHVTGRVVSNGVKLAAETEMTLLLDKDHLLMDGDLYGASVTACNAASLCTTATASLLLVDSTPPTVGTFRNTLSWRKSQTTLTSLNITDINVVLQNFADAESGVIAYYITAGRKYNGDELSRGQIKIPCNSSSHNHNFSVSVHDELKKGDVVYLSVWAENNLGLPSPVARMAFGVLVDDASSMSGSLVPIRHSCDVGYCTKECTCAPMGQVCLVNTTQCRELNQVALYNIKLYTFMGLSNIPQIFSTSAKCLEGHWELADPTYFSNISRFEWSFSLLNKPAGEGVFNVSTESAWHDVGRNSRAIHCLPGTRLLLSEQYVLHVRVWLSSDEHITFTSEPVLIDHTPPQSKRGKVVQESDATCGHDIDYISAQTTIQVCWDGVFSDAQSNITSYELWVGTTPNADGCFQKINVGLNTSFTISTNRFEEGTRYYVTVRAWNGAGLQTTVVSDGVTADVTPPVSGVVFTTKRNTYRRAQAANATLFASWQNFQDTTSGVTSYHLAVKDMTNLSSPLVVLPFCDVGVVPEITLKNLDLKHKHSYTIAVKAIDKAGLQSTIAESLPIMIDVTLPEGVACASFRLHEQRALNSMFINSPFIETFGTSFNIEAARAIELVKIVVNASNVKLGARGYVAIEEQEMPLDFKYSGLQTASAAHVILTPSSNSSLNIIVEANRAANLTAELFLCSNSLTSPEGAVTLHQTSQHSLSVSARIRDHESGMKSMMVGIGMTAGGFQVQPLTPMGHSVSSIYDVHVQHGSPLYATVIAENFAGLMERFVSQPVTIDRTAPVVYGVNTSLTYEGEGNVNKTEVWMLAEWISQDLESGVSTCTCQLEVQQSTSFSSQETSDVSPGRCRWQLMQPKHGGSVYVTISCLNGVQMMTTVSSQSVIIILQSPDITEARITFLSNNEFMSPFDWSDPGVRSPNSSLEFHLTGVSDPTARQLQYRILHESSPIIAWTLLSTNKSSAVLDKGSRPVLSGNITADFRALNERSMVSEIASQTVRLDDSEPFLSGLAASVILKEDKLLIDWDGIFKVNRDVTFSVFAGTVHGYGDVVNHVTTKVTSLEVSCAKHLSDLYVAIKAVYPNGLSQTYEDNILL